ncbi:MAG: endonuclease/exonuclease/phosphatase family protein [Chloroflexi bacterium]|nr:endonuclease/exonuclease/phosphatase family protein [Chloroflexota bacterium]
MLIISWNIRAGGGRRVEQIADQLRRWSPDIVALSEFRATPPSRWLAEALAQLGLAYQRTTADATALASNRLLVASRWPLRRIAIRNAPELDRWLLLGVAAPRRFVLGAMHVPNRVTGRKYPYLDAVLALARRWRGGPALLAGDTNCGRIGIDEESPAINKREDTWMADLVASGWSDAFRDVHGDKRAYTWYSPNAGNGFRLDQAFVNSTLRSQLVAAQYEWGRSKPDDRRDALSDHAALIVELR